jgi:dienelactone hydrolase
MHCVHNPENPAPLANPSKRNSSSSSLPPPPLEKIGQFSRRQQLALLSSLPSITLALPSLAKLDMSAAQPSNFPHQVQQQLQPPIDGTNPPHLPGIPNYAAPGPLQAIRLPNLEHTCTTCDAPAERCRLKIRAWVPKGGGRLGLAAPYPLAIITGGFLIASDQYTSYCERLASWGFVVVTYDRTQAALDPVSDVVCVEFLRDLINWCRTSVPLGRVCDTNSVYLIGHSRGGKISSLAAAGDTRVKALFLIDPVDVTQYAPLSEDFPSAVTAIENIGVNQKRSLPLAVVGSGRGGDCVPVESNYERFFAASEAPTWEVSIPDAGHLQFIDGRQSTAMDLVCGAGKIPDSVVAEITAGMMVAWGQVMIKRGGSNSNSDDGNSDGSMKAEETTKMNKKIATSTRGGVASSSPPVVQMGVDDNGRVVAGLASFDSLQALYSTETTLRSELKKLNTKGAAVFDIVTRSKNFEV